MRLTGNEWNLWFDIYDLYLYFKSINKKYENIHQHTAR